MWNVRRLDFRPVELDFCSAGLGRCSSTSLFADGQQLINAVDLIVFGDSLQIQVCEHCGQTGCAPGGWVTPRLFGGALVLVPCFHQLADESVRTSWAGAPGTPFEYEPPACIRSNGPALFRGESLRALSSQVPVFYDTARWPALSAHELARLVQWYAPGHALGTFPAPPRLRSEFVIAATPGERDEAVSALDEALDRAFVSDAPAEPTGGQAVSFFVDLPGFPAWEPLVLGDTGPRLVFPAPLLS